MTRVDDQIKHGQLTVFCQLCGRQVLSIPLRATLGQDAVDLFREHFRAHHADGWPGRGHSFGVEVRE